MEQLDLRGRLAVVTGASSGIGKTLAARLAAGGAEVIGAARRRPELAGVEHLPVDLATNPSVVEFAKVLERRERPIDLLVLNAGVHIPWRHLRTAEGHELHWQVNYLANFLLVQRLHELCLRSSLKRVVYVASEAHRLAPVGGSPFFAFWGRYATSKEAAIGFMLRLKEQHPALHVSIVSPGLVDTPIHDAKGRATRWLTRRTARWSSAATAAELVLRAMSKPQRGRAVYWRGALEAVPSKRSRDVERAEMQWRGALQALRPHLGASAAAPCVRIRNYAGNVRRFGPEADEPRSVDELEEIVASTAAAGRALRVVGARHSYNDGFFSPSRMVSLRRLDRILDFNPERGEVTCEAGASMSALCDYLDARDLTLRFCGSNGDQSVAGAIATGTHGYGRDGGLLAELVRGATLVSPSQGVCRVRDEGELRALRLGLGTLGVLAEVTLAVEPRRPCAYAVAVRPAAQVRDGLEALARTHAYLRFMPHPLDGRLALQITIDPLTDGAAVEQPDYVTEATPWASRAVAQLLRQRAVQRSLARVMSPARQSYTAHVPFSTRLFMRGGVARGSRWIAKAAMLAFDRPDWLNMELAVPLPDFVGFEQLYSEELARAPLRSRPYFTCRVVGAARTVLLAPNFDRDVVFVDLHADPRDPAAEPFLRRMEERAVHELEARPHWGKLFFSEHATLSRLYPVENLAAFRAAKRRHDPSGVLSNDYTRRALAL